MIVISQGLAPRVMMIFPLAQAVWRPTGQISIALSNALGPLKKGDPNHDLGQPLLLVVG